VIAMSAVREDRYVDLKKLCDKVAPDMFETLSWILIMNLDLIPQEDININPNLRFSHLLMYNKYDEAIALAKEIVASKNPISKHYEQMFELDPKLEKTIKVSESFFALAKRRIEVSEKLGIRQF
jgi:hypothetical protein